MKRRSMLIILMLTITVSAFLGACTNTNSEPPKVAETPKQTESKTDSPKTEPPKEGAKELVFRFNVGTEPPSLDPGLSQDAISFTIVGAMFEGLTTLDASNQVQPGVAEKWDISPDGKKYTFTLRQDAKWSNGDPVTAHDYEYAWKRVLDPNMEKTSPYNYQLYYIKNGEAFFNKTITDPNQIGVKATGDYSLEVELENPTPYFLDLTAFQTYYPVHKSVKDNPAWAAEANTIISNGPYKISSWTHQSELQLVKNEFYNKKDEIKLDKVVISMVSDSNAVLNMYDTNALDYIGPPFNGGIPNEQIPILKQTKKDELVIKPQASTYYYLFNNKEKPFDNKNVRKALAMSIDRQLISDKILLADQKPAYAMVPPGIKGLKEDFRSEVNSSYFKEDVEAAKALLAQGLKESNMEKMPEFTLTYNTDDNHKKIAQAIVDMWKQNLNIDVKIQNAEWGVFLEQRTALNYQVARAGWNPDYNDPMTFLDLYTTGSGNNDLGLSNPAYDKLVKDAKVEADSAKRMKMLADAEKILIEDEMALMPIYFYSSVTLIKPGFTNIYTDPMANFRFERGFIE